ncbi:MAG TPA: hypothetical protein VGM19_12375 [Armatimonadota bacterium]|jgi:hypothetical protein
MSSLRPVSAGGFYLDEGLPTDYYAFADGDLSLTVERNGGINTLGVLDILDWEGKLYPDRSLTPPLLRKEGGHDGKRPLMGPGLAFLSTNRQENGRPGRSLFHFPEQMELYPHGFRSHSERYGRRLEYDLCADQRSLVLRFANHFPTRENLVVILNRAHMVHGEIATFKNQITEQVPSFLKGPDYDPTVPFADDRRAALEWGELVYDPELQAVRLEGRMTFSYGEKGVAVLLGGTRPGALTENPQRSFLTLPWSHEQPGDELGVFLVIGETLAAAHARLEQLRREGDQIRDRKFARAVNYAAEAPEIVVEGLPVATEYARVLPAFEQALLVAETDRETCIRAAAHKYGYFAMWDHISPAKAFLAYGDYDRARKLLRYMIDLPHTDRAYWVAVQMIPAVEEAVALTGDEAFLREVYPGLQRYFATLAAGADATTGMICLDCSSGVDDPKEIGIEGPIWPSCVNGWWYNACRGMENFALTLGDGGTAAEAATLGTRVAAHYPEVFFDPERGYLHAVIDPATGKGTGVYQNVATLGMDYPYGEYLLRDILRPIAEYQAYALCHPAGRSAVAYDDAACEMWKHVLMFQHLGHEAKTARAAGLGDEARRITANYLRLFDRYKVGIETQNLSGADGNVTQEANWQAFGAEAAYIALLSGVIGLQWDRGGLNYVPCDLSGAMSVRSFPRAGSAWDISVTGAGAYAPRFTVDGEALAGTLRVPAEYLGRPGRHTLEIVRGAEPWDRPTLLNAVAAPVQELRSSAADLRWSNPRAAHTSLKLYSPQRPRVVVDGRPVSSQWDETTGIAWCDVQLQPGQTVSITGAAPAAEGD